MKKILTVVGTRPEIIKMAPIVNLLKDNKYFEHYLCSTGQHKELSKEAFGVFNLIPDFDLEVMSANQDLSTLTSKIITKFTSILNNINPHVVLVHGDTTTSFACSLACFYKKINVAHIEAGLRTYNKYSPFPEEMNRVLNSKLATYHFAPTSFNKNNLLKEGIDDKNIFVTGNTGIDSLLEIAKNIDYVPKELNNIKNILNDKFILITGHRRENFGNGFENICEAIKQIAIKYPLLNLIYPVHFNPNVRKTVCEKLKNIPNIYLIEPLSYIPFVYLMKKCLLILTDSGGIQEEAPSLGKPVLVMREITERQEAVEAGTIKLVGTDINKIVNEVYDIIENSNYEIKENPYGDGKASERIFKHLKDIYGE